MSYTYTLVIVLGVLIKRELGHFYKPKEAVKMVFGVRSIRVFSQFLLDPYYELLLWFMIHLTWPALSTYYTEILQCAHKASFPILLQI